MGHSSMRGGYGVGNRTPTQSDRWCSRLVEQQVGRVDQAVEEADGGGGVRVAAELADDGERVGGRGDP